jgi:serine/threonine-protein kinase RsbT
MTEYQHEHVAEEYSPGSLSARSHFAESELTELSEKKHPETSGDLVNLGTRIAIRNYEDIVRARQTGRFMAQKIGFSMNKATIVATAISELARNIILYAKTGEIVITTRSMDSEAALVIAALDEGPGISNVQRAMASGYSTSGGLGIGLSGVRKIADDFEIKSNDGKGTAVIVTVMLQ